MESELEKSANDEIRFEFNNWKKKLSRMSSETAKELEHKDPVQLRKDGGNMFLLLFAKSLYKGSQKIIIILPKLICL